MSDSNPLDDRTLEEATGDERPPLPMLPVRFMQVFFSPGELFARLRDRPAWLGALLLGGVLIGVGSFVIPIELTLEMTRQQFAERGQQVPEGLELGGSLIRWAGVIAGPLFFSIFSVITAGIVTVIFTFLLGGDAKFKQYLSIMAHANLIACTSYLALVPLRISARDPQLLLSVGSLFPFFGDGYLGNFLGLIDLFSLWTWVIAGLGVATVTKGRSWMSAATILMVIPVGLAALFAIWR